MNRQVASEERLFKLVHLACTDPELAKSNMPQFFVNGQQVRPSDLGPILPKSSDGSFQNYRERIDSFVGDGGLCIHSSHFENVDYTLWERSKHFLGELYEQIGMTQLGAEIQLFIGDYRRTPVGIHRDETNVFHFPVIGRKRMRLWSDGFAQEHPEDSAF